MDNIWCTILKSPDWEYCIIDNLNFKFYNLKIENKVKLPETLCGKPKGCPKKDFKVSLGVSGMYFRVSQNEPKCSYYCACGSLYTLTCTKTNLVSFHKFLAVESIYLFTREFHKIQRKIRHQTKFALISHCIFLCNSFVNTNNNCMTFVTVIPCRTQLTYIIFAYFE